MYLKCTPPANRSRESFWLICKSAKRRARVDVAAKSLCACRC